MTDTAQPATAAETEVVPSEDALQGAADAFKTFSAEAPERLRDDKGRFASAEEAEEQEIEAEEEAEPEGEAEAEAESQEDEEEAAEEAQPDLPTSWSQEKAELWTGLPPEAQEYIRQRDGEQTAAVNAKFQEAANLRKAHEAEIGEAQANRQRFAEAAELVLASVRPQKPPLTMLDMNSADYNPDAYHLANAQYEEAAQFLAGVHAQLNEVRAQEQEQAQRDRATRLGQINETYQPVLLKDVPDLAVPEKQQAALTEIADYAVRNGVPEEYFADPDHARELTAPAIHMMWKAMKYDQTQAAKAKVQPKALKPAAPVVKPGVTTTRSSIERAKRNKDFERLDKEGSIEAGAAVFKHFL